MLIGDRLTGNQSTPLTPSRNTTLTGVRYFIAGLITARKSFGEKMFNDWSCFWGQVLSPVNNKYNYLQHSGHQKHWWTGPPAISKKIKTIQDIVAAVAVRELRRMPGHYEGSCTCPTGSVRTNFNILLDVLCLVKKLAMRLQIWCVLRRRCAHFVGRRRDPGSQ